MSYNSFYRFGSKNHSQIEDLIDGTTYGTGFVTSATSNSGDLVFNITHEGGLYWCKNNNTDGSGDHYKGCFKSAEMIQLFPDTTQGTAFSKRTITSRGVSGSQFACVDLTTGVGGEYFVGVAFNGSASTTSEDFWAIQTAGIATTYWAVNGGGDYGHHCRQGTTAGQAIDSGSDAQSGDFGIQVNRVNIGSGSIEMLINGTETY